jgi:deaminated glutathione amidase
LFDVKLENGPTLVESDSVEAGHEIVAPFATELGRVGLMICFDLRFPEISIGLRRRGATLLTYPSAFTVPTGRAHWMALLRARAIENQCYVIAAAQAGAHNEKRRSYGHGIVIDPWGEVMLELGEETNEFGLVEIGLEGEGGVLDRVRREMPLKRRTDVYPEI